MAATGATPSDGPPDAPAEVSVPPVLTPARSSPFATIARGALVLLLLYLIFGVLIPSFADYSDVWDALTSLEPWAFFVLAALAMTVEGCKAGVYTVLTASPVLTFRRAFMAQEAAVVVSNTVPGPSGTAARFVTYRKFGVSSEDFGRSYVVSSVWSNGIPLILPCIAVLLLTTQRDVPGSVIAIAGIGLLLSVVGLVIGVFVLRSERFAFRLGDRVGRLLNWGRGLVHRPPSASYGQTVVDFRFQILDSVREHWASVTFLTLLKELANFSALLVSLRALGVGQVTLTFIEVFAVYALVRLLSMVEITPGGVGVVETLYIAGLLWASDGREESAIVAAVFTFRLFTYLLPILVGGVCWLLLSRQFRAAERAAVSPT